MIRVEWDDVQGLLRGFSHLSHARYLLLRFDTNGDPLRQWIKGQIGAIKHVGYCKDIYRAVNLAFTCTGLRKIGLAQAALDSFPVAFREGMAKRAPAVLGDRGDDDPGHWGWGGSNSEKRIDAVCLLFARGDKTADRMVREQREDLTGIGTVVAEVHGRLNARVASSRTTKEAGVSIEHFGFLDGISQPLIEGQWGSRVRPESCDPGGLVKPGEFVLGYLNEHATVPRSPQVCFKDPGAEHLPPGREPGQRDLGRNGSFLVVRQLDQNVAAFRQALDDLAQARAEKPAEIGARLVGRWPGGAPLTSSPDADDPRLARKNDFGYFERDRHGYNCPIGAHIRRCNPRDTLRQDPEESLRLSRRHRILRRGRVYGPYLAPGQQDDEHERGLMFLCLNSQIERQFEFMQQSWLNSPKFGGLRGESDPLTGRKERGMTLQRSPVRERLTGLPQFITVRGGAYFFLPGLKALHYLANRA